MKQYTFLMEDAPQNPTPTPTPQPTAGAQMKSGAAQFGRGVGTAAKQGFNAAKRFGQNAANGKFNNGKAAAIGAGVGALANWWKNRRNGTNGGYLKSMAKGSMVGMGANMAARMVGSHV